MRDDGGPALPGRPAGETREGEAIIRFENQAAWDAWLEKNHEELTAVWLKIAKRNAAESSVTYEEALESAICFGWIDARKGRYDDTFFLQRFTQRRPRSVWSKRNREKALELMAAGRMRPAGERAVAAARENGQWEAAYEPASTAQVPADFRELLDANPGASAFFATLNGANRYAILYRLKTAKKPETRARRMAKFVEMLDNHETIHPASTEG